MEERRFKVTVEVAPISLSRNTKKEANTSVREVRDGIDGAVRGHLRLGPRSKAVVTRVDALDET